MTHLLPVQLIKNPTPKLPQIGVAADLILGTAGASDVTLNIASLRLRPEATRLQYLMFTLPVDSIALEPDETFQFRLRTTTLVPPGDNIFFLDTVDVTITDAEGELSWFDTATL